MSLTLLVVGAGPRTLGVLDRLSAHASASGAEVDVHVVDPHPAGAGRIWRADQHPLLWMNSRAADVTVLPDASSRLEGPVRTGPPCTPGSTPTAPSSPRSSPARARTPCAGRSSPCRRARSSPAPSAAGT